MIEQYRNQIITGDALALLKTLPDESVDMFLFSPPYNMGVSSGGGFASLGNKEGKWGGGALASGYSNHSDAMGWAEYEAWQRDILRECWRCVPDDGAIFYQHKPRLWDGIVRLPTMYAPEGVMLRQVIIWARAAGMNFAPTHYVPAHEWICVFAKRDWRLKSKGASGVGDVWYIPATPHWHPAPFPLALAVRALETVMPSLVCDPFIGSGTTAKAAVKLGIDYIGFELSEEYAARARKEIAEVAAQPRLIPIEARQGHMEIAQ